MKKKLGNPLFKIVSLMISLTVLIKILFGYHVISSYIEMIRV